MTETVVAANIAVVAAIIAAGSWSEITCPFHCNKWLPLTLASYSLVSGGMVRSSRDLNQGLEDDDASCIVCLTSLWSDVPLDECLSLCG